MWGATFPIILHLGNPLNFNPRTPCGVRRLWFNVSVLDTLISIHAPRVGCDTFLTGSALSGIDFNPRTPCGVRRDTTDGEVTVGKFQSTHPVWGATRPSAVPSSLARIFQSTHPVWGATAEFNGACIPDYIFQSTHPVWGATSGVGGSSHSPEFQSKHPMCGAAVGRELEKIWQ